MIPATRRLAMAALVGGLSAVAAASGPNSAPVFRVVINPEARVSVEVVGHVPAVACGESVWLSLEVINESLGTQNIDVRILSAGARIVSAPLAPLSGAERETMQIAIHLDSAYPLDITLEFDAGPGTDDLGRRSRTHDYVPCQTRNVRNVRGQATRGIGTFPNLLHSGNFAER